MWAYLVAALNEQETRWSFSSAAPRNPGALNLSKLLHSALVYPAACRQAGFISHYFNGFISSRVLLEWVMFVHLRDIKPKIPVVSKFVLLFVTKDTHWHEKSSGI